MRLGQHLCFRLAKAHRFAIGALHLPRQKKPCGNKQDQRQPVHQQGHKPWHAVAQGLGRKIDALLAQTGNQGRVIGGIGLEGPAIGQGSVNIGTGDHNTRDTTRIDLAQKLSIAHILRRGALAWILEQSHQRQDQKKYNGP